MRSSSVVPEPAVTLRRTTASGAREDGTYKIQPNDTYWAISEKVYGTGGYFKALVELNRDKFEEADRLQVGAVISDNKSRKVISSGYNGFPRYLDDPRDRQAVQTHGHPAHRRQLRAYQRVAVVGQRDVRLGSARCVGRSRKRDRGGCGGEGVRRHDHFMPWSGA